jgi:hypothetical protein
LYQGALWGWGGTLAIPTIDFYFMPEILWQGCDCNLPLSINYIPINNENRKNDLSTDNKDNINDNSNVNDKSDNHDGQFSSKKNIITDAKNSIELNSKNIQKNKSRSIDHQNIEYSTTSNDEDSFNMRKRLNSVKPQELFSEQIVFFSGIPQLPITPPTEINELWKILQSRYLFPPQNRTHIYIFPGSIRHLHPEFDSALSILLRTDPMVMVVLAGMYLFIHVHKMYIYSVNVCVHTYICVVI